MKELKKLFLLALIVLIAGLFIGCPEKKSNVNPAPAVALSTQDNTLLSNYGKKTNRAADAVKAPDFSLPDLQGGTITLSNFIGKIIILDFWATWCPPCKAEIPGFIALNNKYEKSGVILIGAAVDDLNKVKSFAKNYGINYPVCIADQNTTTNYGGIRGIPTTFVIDKEGYIVREYVGFRPEETFEKDILDLM